MLTIEETKNCKFWRLINSAAKNIESLNIKQSKKQELYSNLYEIKDINKKLLESAEKGLEYIQNGIEFGYISPDQESETPELLRKAINKAKRDGEMKVTLLRDMETSTHKFIKGEVGRIVEYPLEHASTDLVKVWANGKDLICAREDLKFWKDDK